MLVLGETPPAAARLLILAGQEPAGQRHPAAVLWQRLRAGLLRWTSAQEDGAALQIEDLQGRRVLALRGARPPVELTLPPGTYHVSVKLCGVQRRYTVTLEAGTESSLRVAA